MNNVLSTVVPNGYSLNFEMTRDSMPIPVSKSEINNQMVRTNYQYWNILSNFDSCNNYDSEEFHKIVAMGEDAVPEILNIIKERPDPIVHALDLIYPNYMEYKGNVTLEEVCKIWIITLLAQGKA